MDRRRASTRERHPNGLLYIDSRYVPDSDDVTLQSSSDALLASMLIVIPDASLIADGLPLGI